VVTKTLTVLSLGVTFGFGTQVSRTLSSIQRWQSISPATQHMQTAR